MANKYKEAGHTMYENDNSSYNHLGDSTRAKPNDYDVFRMSEDDRNRSNKTSKDRGNCKKYTFIFAVVLISMLAISIATAFVAHKLYTKDQPESDRSTLNILNNLVENQNKMMEAQGQQIKLIEDIPENNDSRIFDLYETLEQQKKTIEEQRKKLEAMNALTIAERCANGETLIPHPTKCAQFYNCSIVGTSHSAFSENHLDECSYPELFNPVFLACAWYTAVDCGAKFEPLDVGDYEKRGLCFRGPCGSPSCKGRGDGANVDTMREGSPYFIYCKDQRYLLGSDQTCPSRFIFNGTARNCVFQG